MRHTAPMNRAVGQAVRTGEVNTAGAFRRGSAVAVAVAVLTGLVGVILPVAVPAAAAAPATVPIPGSVPRLPIGAKVTGALAQAATLSVDVTLQPRDPAALAAFVNDVSTPGNPLYHHYLARGQFASRFGPAPSTISAVRSWLIAGGLHPGPTTSNGLAIPITARAEQLDAVLASHLVGVTMPSGRHAYTTTTTPRVPLSLGRVVAAVIGLNDLVRPHSMLARAPGARPATASPGLAGGSTTAPRTSSPQTSGPTACSAAASAATSHSAYTADQLAGAYGFTGLYGKGWTGAGITVGILELEPYLPSDVQSYFTCYGLTNPVTNVTVDGGAGTGAGQGEAALDIEDVAGLAPGAAIAVYSGPNNGGSGLYDIYNTMISNDTAQVITTSWGQCEADYGSASAADSSMNAEATLFAQAVTQGQSVFAAAGDSGSEDCYYQSTNPSLPSNLDSSLAVDDPAVQPDVTGVGGTDLLSATFPPPETVWNGGVAAGAGGGGVSTVFTMPSWQRGPGVQNPFTSPTTCRMSTGTGTTGCREVPDVTASADPSHGYVIFYKGSWASIGGTSAAAPLWAALAAVADQAVGATSGTGPWNRVVTAGEGCATNDITTGNNDMLGAHGGDFPATPNYDLASGWGSPVGGAIVAELTTPCPVVTGLGTTTGSISGGYTTTIAGTSLSGASSVHFGSIPATITGVTSTSITVTVPAAAAAGTAPVRVTGPGGTSASVPADVFTYVTYLSDPQVMSVSPTAGPVAGGTSVTITGAGLGAVTTVDFGSVASSSFTIVNSTTITAIAPSQAAGTVDVTVADPSGTSPIVGGDQYTYDPVPTVTSLSPASGPVTGGTSVVANGTGMGPVTAVSVGGAAASILSTTPTSVTFVVPARSTTGTAGVVVTSPGGTSVVSSASMYTFVQPPPGYWLVASDGGIFAFGAAGFHGSTGGLSLNKPIVGMAATPDGKGYWLVASDGGIFSFGDAGFYGSTGALTLNKPIVGMAATPDGKGYWLVASDGGIFAFGDAVFKGSTGALALNKPIVGMAPSYDGTGYWLVASDGGIFAFGDAVFKGSTGALALNKPIVGMSGA